MKSIQNSIRHSGLKSFGRGLLLAVTAVSMLAAQCIHAAIALQDGSTTITAVTGNPTTVSQPFTVTAGASVLVVIVGSKNGTANPVLSTLTWNGSQTIGQAISRPYNDNTYRPLTIYYLYNPTPGSGNITGTFSAATPTSYWISAYTLSGVDTTVAPITNGNYNVSTLSISAALAGIPNNGWAAVGSAYGGGAGFTLSLTSSGGGSLTSNTKNDTDATTMAMGYFSGVPAGSSTFTSTAGGTSPPSQKLSIAVALFTPAGAVSSKWSGAGAGGSGTDFNTLGNWSAAQITGDFTSLNGNTSVGTIGLSANYSLTAAYGLSFFSSTGSPSSTITLDGTGGAKSLALAGDVTLNAAGATTGVNGTINQVTLGSNLVLDLNQNATWRVLNKGGTGSGGVKALFDCVVSNGWFNPSIDLNLSNPNSSFSRLWHTGGTLTFTSIGNKNVNSSLGAGSVAPEIKLNNNTALVMNGAPSAQSSDRTLWIANTGTLNNNDPNYTLTLTGSVLADSGANGTLVLGGSNPGDNLITALMADQSTKSLSVTKNGSGIWYLANNTNSFSGKVLSTAGTLKFSSIGNKGVNSALGAGSVGGNFQVGMNNGGITMTNASSNQSSDRDFQIVNNASLKNNDTSYTLALTGTLKGDYGSSSSGNLRLGGANTGLNTVSGLIANNNAVGTAVVSLTKEDAGNWFVNNNTNSYGGTTLCFGGTLYFTSVGDKGVNSALGSGSGSAPQIGLNNGVITLTNATGNQSTDRDFQIVNFGSIKNNDPSYTLTLTGTVKGDYGSATAGSLRLGGSNSGANLVGAVIADNNVAGSAVVGVVKEDSGQWTLSGNNTYTGGTTVSGGTLRIANTSGSGTGTGSVTVNSGGTLGGNGIISGATTFNAGSHCLLTVGSVLTLSGALTVATNTTIPDVHLILSNNVPVGNYVLATYNTSGSSGAFDSTPVVDSGSFAANTLATIVTSGGTVSLQVVTATVATTTTVTTSGSPSTYGQNVTFTAMVAPQTGVVVPTGTVQFKTNGVAFGSPLTVTTGVAPNGTASISTTDLPVTGSPHSITAEYLPTGNFSGSTGTLIGGQTVNPAALTVTAGNDSKVYGQTKSYGPGSTNFISSGLVNGQTIGSVTITATSSPTNGTAANAPVGSYNLTPSAATGGTFAAANYAITYVNGTLTVAAASNPIAQSINVSGGNVTVTFTGLQDVTYVTESTTNLMGTWTPISTNTPGIGGTWNITGPVAGGQTFYRTLIP